MNARLVLGAIALAIALLAIVVPIAIYIASPGKDTFIRWLIDLATKSAWRWRYLDVETAKKLGARYTIENASNLLIYARSSRIVIEKGLGIAYIYGEKHSVENYGNGTLGVSMANAVLYAEIPRLRVLSIEGDSLAIGIEGIEGDTLSLDVSRSFVDIDGARARQSIEIAIDRGVLRGSIALDANVSSIVLKVDKASLDLDLYLAPGIGLEVTRKNVGSCIIDVEAPPCRTRCIPITIVCSNGIIRIDVER